MKKQKHRTHRTADGDERGLALLFCALRTLAVTVAAASLFAVISAGILSMTPDPVKGVGAAALVSLGLSCIAGGIAARITARERAETAALASGGMLVCLLAAAALITGGMDRPLYTLLGYAAAVLLEYLSAKAAKKLLGAKKRKRRAY